MCAPFEVSRIPVIYIARDTFRFLNPVPSHGQTIGSVCKVLGAALEEQRAFRRLPPQPLEAQTHRGIGSPLLPMFDLLLPALRDRQSLDVGSARSWKAESST
jgi:hypothetical protein